MNINNIINHINSIKRGTYKKRGVCILIGAGADISSGGILFHDLKIRFLKENNCILPHNVSEKLLDEQFEMMVEKLTQDGRCETLDKIMRKHKTPSEGYSLLVMLAEMGYIDAVITTNFDYLLEETQELLNLNPFTIYTPGRAVPEKYYRQRSKIPPLYLKMHGDLFDRLVTHLSKGEIQSRQYGENFINLFDNIIQNNSLIIVGYSGYDNLITEIFRQEINSLDEVYWCNICEPQQDSDLVKLLKQEKKLCYVNTSFDNLFQELAKNLLKDAKMKNANPIFLPTVVQSKIENQKSIFSEKFVYHDKLINRKDAQNLLENYLQTFDVKCIAVIGDYKFGKSSFSYKVMQSMQDITFLPIIYKANRSILESMAEALGYDTDIPFSIMYSFLKWWNEKKEHLIFIMDEFFNQDSFKQISTNYIVEFFNFLYVAREFKYIQFIICFQSNVYNELKKNNDAVSLNEIISGEVNIEKFSENEVAKLIHINGADNYKNTLLNQQLLRVPYVWEIVNENNICLSDNIDFFAQYTNALYNIATKKYSFTKHALNTVLRKFAYNQLFQSNKQADTECDEYIFLQQNGIIDINNKIRYPELTIYYCKQYFLKSASWEEVISENIIPGLQMQNSLSDIQVEVYVSIWSEVKDIDKYDYILQTLDQVIAQNTASTFLSKIVLKVLQKCFKYNKELFRNYLTSIDMNAYSADLQSYLFKTCAEYYPQILTIWEDNNRDDERTYAAFIIRNDSLYYLIKMYLKNKALETEFLEQIKKRNSLIQLFHIMTYFGWDNLNSIEYDKVKDIIINKVIPEITFNDESVKYFADVLLKYSYNIFFNAGKDFEEQFIRCQNMSIIPLIQKVLSKKSFSFEDYTFLLKLNTDINNSWLFIISNIIIVQAMKNQPNAMFELLYHYWDNIQFDVQVQHLDFFLSSAFWSLYINEPCNRDKFVAIFNNVVEKYERILFMLPATQRMASITKFSEEFDSIFEDGFNPLAFYFYTAPYRSLTSSAYMWESGKEDLAIYWNLAHHMSELGKFDDMLRIIHALGQMISIYPEEGYSALKNLTGFDQPIIKRGIIRIFKENYFRYSKITKKELQNPIYHFENDEIEKIVYNKDFLLENRTLEQLHWSRLFYNLGQIMSIDASEVFLSNFVTHTSCLAFVRDIIKGLMK